MRRLLARLLLAASLMLAVTIGASAQPEPDNPTPALVHILDVG